MLGRIINYESAIHNSMLVLLYLPYSRQTSMFDTKGKSTDGRNWEGDTQYQTHCLERNLY